ncbi:MAG: Assimilatory nitrate reductase electron transfer subunit [Syntrophorhabdus sp. PtaU1.Bin058]|nr:MAG: Assimilatory nitrate reductase electron transfer subunit [Syntrophorhabdus sp. PtaU1.Bin058]
MVVYNKYLIIGNGVAGIYCAFNIRMRDRKGEITIVTDENYPFYSRPLITDVMTGKKQADDIVLLPENGYKRYGFTLMKGVQVKKAVFKERCVTTTAGKQRFDRLVFAAGAVPKKIPFEGEGIFYVRTLEDAERIRAYLPKVKKAVVFGGGPIGIKAAYALMTAGIPVNIIISSSQMLSRVLDERSSHYLQVLFEQNGARFWFNSDIKEIVRRKKGLKGIVTDKGEMVPGDILIVGKGVNPNLDIVRNAGVRIDKGILVDDYMETNCEGVYAAGDVAQAKVVTNSNQQSAISNQPSAGSSLSLQGAQHHGGLSLRAQRGNLTNRIATAMPRDDSKMLNVEHRTLNVELASPPFKDVLSLWPVGAEQGKIAGQNMAGGKRVYGGGVGSNSIEYFGLKAISMGITRGEGCEAVLFERDGIYRRYLFDGERLVGAILVGDINDAGVLLHAIRQALPVRGILQSAISSQRSAFPFQSLRGAERRGGLSLRAQRGNLTNGLPLPLRRDCDDNKDSAPRTSEIDSPLSALRSQLSMEVLF